MLIDKKNVGIHFTCFMNIHLQNDFCFEKRDWMTVQKHELPDRNKLVRNGGLVYFMSSCLDFLSLVLIVSLFSNFTS